MIAILTPTRARPARFAEMVAAVKATSETQVTIYAGLGLDDEHNYERIPGVRYVVQENAQLVDWTNRLAVIALEDGCEILASLGDDHLPRTQGWDTQILAAFARMGSGLVYGRDGIQDERLPTAPFWSADVIEALGWFAPPSLIHMYCDNWWLHLATALGCWTYLPEVLIEHCHPSAGKAPMDQVYEANDLHYDRDGIECARLVRDDLPAIAELVALRIA